MDEEEHVLYTDESQSLILSVPLTAIYLCKRTMQNKTRLELADYEAVSSGLFLYTQITTCWY